MYCEPIEEWKHITANKQKRQKVLDLLSAFAYLKTVRNQFAVNKPPIHRKKCGDNCSCGE